MKTGNWLDGYISSPRHGTVRLSWQQFSKGLTIQWICHIIAVSHTKIGIPECLKCYFQSYYG